MIIEYHRPDTIEVALTLLQRPEPLARVLAGGSSLVQPTREKFAVVDLRELGLDSIQIKGNMLEIGAMVTLEKMLQFPTLSFALQEALRKEAPMEHRRVRTVAGSVMTSDGRSPFSMALLALEARLTVQPDNQVVGLDEVLPLADQFLKGRLITAVSFSTNVGLDCAYDIRSPEQHPVIGVAIGTWRSGRTRIVLGGYGRAPLVAFDGPDAIGAEIGVRSAYSEAGDAFATAAYRQETAVSLTRMILREGAE